MNQASSRPRSGAYPLSLDFALSRPFLLALAAFLAAGTVRAQTTPPLDVPYVPTPQEVVDRMLEIAGVKAGDFVMDVGCGDGRMVVTAARQYGARGLGVDINPERIEEARQNARAAGVADKVEFRQGNLFETDISRADVLAMYLLERINLELRPKILATTRPGTRIVSHAFTMGDWKPDRQDAVDGRQIYFWVVPARVEGRWKLQQGKDNLDLKLKQAYQEFSGEAIIGGRTVPVRQGRLQGADISFAVETEPGQTRIFRGRVDGNAMTAVGGEGTAWQARRL